MDGSSRFHILVCTLLDPFTLFYPVLSAWIKGYPFLDPYPYPGTHYYEVDSLDPCWGHSNEASQYHYHLTPDCIGGAADNSSCLQLGYMDDGFPVYGQCGTYREVQQAFAPEKKLC